MPDTVIAFFTGMFLGAISVVWILGVMIFCKK